MRAWSALVVSALTLLPVLVVLAPSAAVAGPVAELCATDAGRGGVPADFALDACADATSLTVRNDLDVPVLVRADGDLRAPSPVHERGSATAAVLRLAADPGTVLVPGDVVRWPLGAGAAGLTVSGLRPAAVPAIVGSLEPFLPSLGGDDVGVEDYRAFAVVARETSAAVQARAACLPGKNFLQVAACDVFAATTVGRAAVERLPHRAALQVLSVGLDPARWADWSAAGGLPRTLGALRLTQQPVPVPPAPAPAAVAPPAAAVPAVPAPPPVPGLGHRTIGDLLEDVLGRPSAGDDDERGTSNGKGKAKGKGKGR